MSEARSSRTRAYLDLLDARIEIEADDDMQLRGLLSVYGSVSGLPVARRALIARLARLTSTRARLELDGGATVGVGVDATSAGAATAFALLHHVAPAVRGCLLLHAAVIDGGAGPTVIAAPSGLGKTTLALASVLAGARFGSDELAVIARDDGRVLPFPRAVGIRPGPLVREPRIATACARASRVEERGGGDKHLVDLLATGLALPVDAAPARSVVMLAAGALPGASLVRDSPGSSLGATIRYRLDVDRSPEPVAAALAEVDGVVAADVIAAPDAPAITIEARVDARLARAIDAACAANGVTAIRFVDERTAAPDFEGTASLTEVAPGAALPQLMRYVENGPGLIDGELDGSAGRLLLELGRLLGEARFFRMRVGDLASSTALLARIAA